MKNGHIDQTRKSTSHWYISDWWEDRTKKQKCCIYLLVGFLTVIIVCAGFYFLFTVEPEVCTSPMCVKTAMELLNNIDKNIDPCDDFYRFACGNFQNTARLDSSGSKSVKDLMEEKIQAEIKAILEEPIRQDDPRSFNLAKKFYRACMNESAIEVMGLKGIKGVFEKIGGWPMLEGDKWRQEEFDWKNAVVNLREIGVNFEVFFVMSVDQDEQDPTKNIIYIEDPLYSPSEISSDVKAMYLDYMVDIAVQFGVDRNRAKREQQEVLSFFLQLAKISSEAKEASNGTSHVYNPFSPSELQHEFPSVPWFQFLNAILRPSGTLTHDDAISVSQPLYFRKLDQILTTTTKRILGNFIVWQTFQHLINYLPSTILDRGYEFLEKVNGIKIRKPRWNTCIQATEDRLDSAVSAAYVEQYFDEDTRLRVMDIIRNIKTQFKHNLAKLDWLDKRTKTMAMEKLLTSVEEIVSYKDLVESIEQQKIYDELIINENEFLKSALDLDYINLNVKFGKFRKRVKDNRLRQSGFVTGLNIVFSPKENILRFPIGIFRGVYYAKDRPQYMNYGVLGSIVAHEISHIFIEAEYGYEDAELRSSWSGTSLLNYEEKLQCLADHYAQFIVPEVNKHLNSSRTRNEDFADLAGTKVSYDTYQNYAWENGAEPRLPGITYSPNQLFWISSAQHLCSKYSSNTMKKYMDSYMQSPQQFRVNGPLQNIEEFAFDWGCKRGAKMDPIIKCTVW